MRQALLETSHRAKHCRIWKYLQHAITKPSRSLQTLIHWSGGKFMAPSRTRTSRYGLPQPEAKQFYANVLTAENSQRRASYCCCHIEASPKTYHNATCKSPCCDTIKEGRSRTSPSRQRIRRQHLRTIDTPAFKYPEEVRLKVRCKEESDSWRPIQIFCKI